MKANLKIFSLAALASLTGLGVAALAGQGLPQGMKLAAGEDSTRSFTITAEDIRAALKEDGSATARREADFDVNGMTFHIDNAYYADGRINVSGGAFYNVTLAGSSASADRRVGTGFQKVTVKGFDSKTGANSFFQNSDLATVEEHPLGAVKEDQTITYAGTQKAARFQFAFGAGEGTYFSSVTYVYGCADALPTLNSITGDTNFLDVGGVAHLSANASFLTGAATFTWSSSDSEVATVEGSGAEALVTGIKGGSAIITCILKDGEVTSSAEFAVKVNAQAAAKKELSFLDDSRVEGAGVFVNFSPKALGMSYANVVEYLNGLQASAKVIAGSQAVNSAHFQDMGEEKATYYVSLSSAAVSGPFALEVTFKDASANLVYQGNIYFKDGKIAPSVSLDGASSVLVGQTIELTAEKGYFLAGEATYAYSSDNEDIATVSGDGASVTVKGVKAGTATITVSMKIGEKTYQANKKITVVTEAMKPIALTPTGGEQEGASFRVRGLDNTIVKAKDAASLKVTALVNFTNKAEEGSENYSAIQGFCSAHANSSASSYNIEGLNASSSSFDLSVSVPAGTPTEWDILWEAHVEITAESGQVYTVDASFFHGAYLAVGE